MNPLRRGAFGLVVHAFGGLAAPHAMAVCLLGSISNAAGGETAVPVRSVDWEEIRASIESRICSRSMEHDGRTYYYPSTGSQQECGRPEGESSSLDPIVDAAWVEARPLIGSLEVAAELRKRLPDVAPEARDRAARDAYLEEPRFLRALVPRIEVRMREAGLECARCPSFPTLPMRTIPYAEFRPYLEAYVWPDEVTDRLDTAGVPTGEKLYGIHFCEGLNGVAELQDPDPDLLRAGFVVVSGNETIMESARQVFRARWQKRDVAKLASDKARTELLRREVPAAVFSGNSVLRAVCDSLARFENDLALHLAECRQ